MVAAAVVQVGGPASAVPIGAGQSAERCVDGRAGFFPCDNVDLQAFIPVADLGGGRLSDVWGWVDAKTKREYALVGSSQGLKFVDVTKPTQPVYLGALIKPESALIWQDVEVFEDHAFVVCDLSPCGMQVFDLTRLRGAAESQRWAPDLVYPATMTTHTIDIDTASGFAYLNGAYLSGGSLIVDVNNPKAPVAVGAIQDDGYTHDSHCRVYRGPDKDHRGKEICFNANEDTVTIYDVTNKALPEQLARVTYKNATYTHQAWLTEDHSHILVSDEIDEQQHGINSTTYIFDVSDLDQPKYVGKYVADNPSIDHNNYIKGNLDYQASYTAGLRILDVSRVAQGRLREVGFFDVVPDNDAPDYDGSWGVYPYLRSGNVLVTGMGQGLFIVRPRI